MRPRARAGAEDIKRHKWFRGLNWAALYNKQLAAHIVPSVKSSSDTSQYDRYPDSDDDRGPPLLDPAKDRELFGAF